MPRDPKAKLKIKPTKERRTARAKAKKSPTARAMGKKRPMVKGKDKTKERKRPTEKGKGKARRDRVKARKKDKIGKDRTRAKEKDRISKDRTRAKEKDKISRESRRAATINNPAMATSNPSSNYRDRSASRMPPAIRKTPRTISIKIKMTTLPKTRTMPSKSWRKSASSGKPFSASFVRKK